MFYSREFWFGVELTRLVTLLLCFNFMRRYKHDLMTALMAADVHLHSWASLIQRHSFAFMGIAHSKTLMRK